MRFVCDRCGKKYATAGDPAPGKVYKLKCKACGHLIVVKGQAGTMTGLPAVTAAEVASATQMQEPALTPVPAAPEVELHVEPEPDTTPAPTPVPGTYGAVPEQQPEPVSDDAIEPLPPAPLPPEVAMAVDSAAGAPEGEPELEPEPLAPPVGAEELPEASPMLLDPALAPPPPEKDELADFAAAAAEVMAEPSPVAAGQAGGPGFVDLFGGEAASRPGADRFAAAARASLPDTWAGTTPGAAQPAPRPAPFASAPAPAKAIPQRSGLSGLPIAIIGVGMLALIGITAYALLGHGGSPPPVVSSPGPAPAPVPPKAETPPPAPEPATEKKAEPTPEPAPEPKAAEKKPEPKPEPRARPPERKPDKKPEPKVAEKPPEPARAPPPPAPEPRTETRDVELPDAAAALTPDVVNKVIGANRKAFSTCIAAASGSDVKLDGRRVALRITVNTNGTVTYPTLDDQSLNTTEMGQCLKSAARLMIFPKFKGDPFHYEVPLILSGN